MATKPRTKTVATKPRTKPAADRKAADARNARRRAARAKPRAASSAGEFTPETIVKWQERGPDGRLSERSRRGPDGRLVAW